jgi:hypothetical protein
MKYGTLRNKRYASDVFSPTCRFVAEGKAMRRSSPPPSVLGRFPDTLSKTKKVRRVAHLFYVNSRD